MSNLYDRPERRGKCIWVDEVNGSDDNDGTSPESAFLTRQRALAAVTVLGPDEVIIRIPPCTVEQKE